MGLLVHVWVQENVSVRDPSTTHCTGVVSEFGDLDTFSSVVNYSFWRLLEVVRIRIMPVCAVDNLLCKTR